MTTSSPAGQDKMVQAGDLERSQGFSAILRDEANRLRALADKLDPCLASASVGDGELRDAIAKIIDPNPFTNEVYQGMYPDRATLEGFAAYQKADAILDLLPAAPPVPAAVEALRAVDRRLNQVQPGHGPRANEIVNELRPVVRAALSGSPPTGETAQSSDGVADRIITDIEKRFPNWSSYRDLIDCIDCTLHDLRKGSAPSDPNPRPREGEAIRLIQAERGRQISGEGWTEEHDDSHTDESLAMAAALYAAPKPLYEVRQCENGVRWVDPWPWQRTETYHRYGDGDPTYRVADGDNRSKHPRRRRLVIAGALILAEIERLDRAASPGDAA